MRNLEQTRERGQLLHFFANHELLATELMALVLLKFPEAPAAFARASCRRSRMSRNTRGFISNAWADCGIHFGELPVSGYFWRSVSTMENPLDYVSSLCLTFEQANLDFARHYAATFAQVGDQPTAELLEKIYRDEIGHVAYGLKWFRRWKNPDESDWDAFCRQLKFPLSPQRAKGITLNVAGRRAAGLTRSSSRNWMSMRNPGDARQMFSSSTRWPRRASRRAKRSIPEASGATGARPGNFAAISLPAG